MTVYHKNGKWYYNFMLDGKRYHRACKGATSHREALQFENIVKAEIMRGNLGITEKKCTIKLSEMIKKYLEYSELNKSSFTHDKTYSRYWLEFFGNQIISNIKPIDIEGYKKYRNEIVKPSTVNRELNSLSKMFSIAVNNNYIEKNPCQGVHKLKVENIKIRYLTSDEEKRLFEAIDDHWIKPIVICALQTGMRKTEILDLTWDCVDFTQKYITVLQTKNGKSRQIPISQKLIDALQGQEKIKEYIFINPITKNRHGNINDIFPHFLKKAQIKNFRFHDLRHTAATRMVEKGVDLIVVMDILGHSDIKTTMRYAHPVPEMKLRAINILNDY